MGGCTQAEIPVPVTIKTGSADQLWNFVASTVGSFVQEQFASGRIASSSSSSSNPMIPLAFTFSYPVYQPSLNRGILKRWTKDFDVTGVVGKDVVVQFEAALERHVSTPTPSFICSCDDQLICPVESTGESARTGQ